MICHVKMAGTLATVKLTVNDWPTAMFWMSAGSTRMTVASAKVLFMITGKESSKKARTNK
jgi:hypothetical protein